MVGSPPAPCHFSAAQKPGTFSIFRPTSRNGSSEERKGLRVSRAQPPRSPCCLPPVPGRGRKSPWPAVALPGRNTLATSPRAWEVLQNPPPPEPSPRGLTEPRSMLPAQKFPNRAPVSELGRAGPGEALRVERGRRLHRRDPRARRPRARSRILSRHCGRLYRTGLPPPTPARSSDGTRNTPAAAGNRDHSLFSFPTPGAP